MAESAVPTAPASVRSAGVGEYHLASKLFLKLLALIYLAAFASLAPQILALAGSGGIYPLSEQLSSFAELSWPQRLLHYPSVFWWTSADWFVEGVAWAGGGVALLLLSGRLERLALVVLFVLYLSLTQAGQIFLNFQWDYLLLEAGFLAIFLAGGGRVVIWLFRWLLFRLRFLSGLSKLVSNDPGWAGLTALTSYFETQPLPHVGAWYADHLPDWLLRFGTGATLFIELLVPLFFFLPRRWRLAGAGLTILWQLLIILTSNHNFFNLLTIALCLFLLDDRAVARLLPARLAQRWRGTGANPPPRRAWQTAAALVALVTVPLSLVLGAGMLLDRPLPPALTQFADALRPFHLTHRYHVFPTIDTERIELQIEGSVDGTEWRPYEFRYRPDEVGEAPRFIVPHQPRIDWMMWFAPKNPIFLDWLDRFLTRLLERRPEVLAQLGPDPFAEDPARELRVRVYRYRFSDSATRAATGQWWQREPLGPFFPLPVRRAPAQ